MKKFKSFYEDMTFKVEVEGLPALFMAGNSPGQVKSHLRKLIKQPSMIKSVERQTKHDVKKMYRAKAQGKEVAEATLDELSPATVQSYKKAASKSNYNAAQKYARVAASPTSRKYKNKEMDKQDDIMRKRKAGLAMADKKESNELDERTPIRPTVQDKKLKNLRVPNPNYKGLLKRKEKEKRDIYREGTMGDKPEWGTPEATRKAKKVTPGETCENNCGCNKCRKENAFNPQDMVGYNLKKVYKKTTNEKITIGKIRRAAYKTARVLGDVQAVKKGKVARRVKNRIVGKMLGKAVSKLGLFK